VSDSRVSVGVAFASTGGFKIIRAVRSFHLQEPSLPVHVVIDASSNTWKSERFRTPLVDYSYVQSREVDNYSHINGTLNHAVRWMGELGYTHAALFHDDLIFSPLARNRNYLTSWINRLAASQDLRSASALSFGELEAFVKNPGTVRGQPGHWDAPPSMWDAMDLESPSFWESLIALDGTPLRTADFPVFFVDYCPAGEGLFDRRLRMGPTGQIVNIAAWEAVGGFDEAYGLHYDTDFPFACITHSLPPVLYIPGAPHLHLHNQSMGYADPALGLWGHFEDAFERKYHKVFHDFCVEVETERNANPVHIEG